MSGAQKAIKQKARYTNLVVDYLLQQLVDPQTTADPLATAAHLYVFKASFERSPMPRVASLCFERGLLSFLTSILQRDYHPKDKSNEVLILAVTHGFVLSVVFVSLASCPSIHPSVCPSHVAKTLMLDIRTNFSTKFFHTCHAYRHH